MIRIVQNSFFGGQLDYEMMGRQDYQRYAKGATKLCNFNILKRGGLDKRRGFDRILDLTTIAGITASSKFRMIPFAYKKTQGFVIILTPARCFVVGTNPRTQYKTYEITDMNGIYSSSEIDELDYQQCGDVIFIAHQNHRPARIVHDIDSVGEDGFHYEVLELNTAGSGVPEISDAVVTRIAVDQANASTYTEQYKATAVFDGEETFPCNAYKNSYSPNNASSWHGTSYRMPWTESQKISLTINPKTRVVDGEVQYPEEIRIYKKSFNYYGLIGTVKLDLADEFVTVDWASGQTAPATHYCDSDKDASDFSIFGSVSPSARGRDRASWLLAAGDYNIALDKASKSGFVTLHLGAVYYTIDEEGDSVEFKYKGWANGVKVTAEIGGVATELDVPQSDGDKTETVERGEGETDEQFRIRWRDAFAMFCDSLTDITSVNVPFECSTAVNALKLSVSGGSLPVNQIVTFNRPDITSVNFDDKYITPSTNITPPEADDEAVMSGDGNYPASVSLSQQRLIWASSKKNPARVWLSAIGDFYTYVPHEIQVPDDAIDFTLPITRFAKINHICEMRKLLMFNSACEWLVDSASSVSGLTYETIQAYPQSYSGSNERLKPIICNNSLIFCERTGQAVRRFAYDISNDGFAGRDVSILSSSIFEFNSIRDWTYQQFPHSTLWCVLTDGTMASFEFMEEQDIMAWMTHKLGGNGKVKCIATSYAVAPAMDEVADVDSYAVATHEEIFAIVVRGNAVWLERMRVRSAQGEDSIYHSLCLDGVRVLNQLNGYQPTTEDGAIWIPNDTTDGKAITREEALVKIANGVEVYEGFPFDAEYVSVFPTFNGALGNGQFDIKQVCGCGLRLMYSFGGTVCPVGSKHPEPIPYFYNDPENDHRPRFENGRLTLFNHDTNMISLSSANVRDGRISVKQCDPYPFTCLMFETDIEVETGGYR